MKRTENSQKKKEKGKNRRKKRKNKKKNSCNGPKTCEMESI